MDYHARQRFQGTSSRSSGAFVYIATAGKEDFPCKVGMSANPEKRIASLQAGSPIRLHLREFYWLETRRAAAEIERRFHAAHAEHVMNSEWFGLTFEDANFWLFCQLHGDGQ